MRMTKILLTLAVLASALAASSLAAPASNALDGKITVRSWEKLKGEDVTDGGVAATGNFKISGAFVDTGTVTDYRRVSGDIITIRRVTVGKRGAITFRITIRMNEFTPARWVITSATKAYKRVRGKGTQVVDNFNATPATFVLKGTVAR
jgi:hypothetical protein